MSDKLNFGNFPILVDHLNIGDLSSISNEVFTYIDKNKENFKKNWNCNTLSSLKLENSFQGPYTQDFLLKINKLYSQEFNFQTVKPLKLEIESLWVNIAPKGAYQEVHSHTSFYTRNLFSGVLYISTLETSGNLNLLNPLYQQFKHFLSTPIINSEITISPKNGRIVLFPSFIEHYVDVNPNLEERISISWNIKVKQA